MKKKIIFLLVLVMLTSTACSTTPPTIAVSAVILSSESLDMTVGDTHQLSCTILPKDATNRSVTWQSSNSSIAKVTNGRVVAQQPGEVTITAYTDNGVVAKCHITVQQKSAYFRLSSEEKEFVDLFVLYARSYFLNPSSVSIKSISNVYGGGGWWLQLTAQNKMGGKSDAKLYLDKTGLWEGTAKKAYGAAEMDIDLINEAIQEKI
jgi:hypothetical protein